MTVTVKANALQRILTHAAPFASTDAMLPAICGVRLFVDGPQLVAEATDRFVACRSRVEFEEASEHFTVLLASDDVKRILTLTKGARGLLPSRPLVLTLVGDSLSVFDEWGGTSLACRVVELDYPRLVALFTKAREDNPGQRDVIHLNPNVFVTLVKALGRKVNHATFKLPTTDNGAVHVTVSGSAGDGFEAIVMLRRGLS